MIIRLIQKLAELDGGQFLEVFPGPFKGRSWNENSVYIEDETFALMEFIVKRQVPEFDHCSNSAVSKDSWIAIISDLQALKDTLVNANSIEELPESMQFRSDDSRGDFNSNFQENVRSFTTLIDALIAWLTHELESQAVISVLGI